MFSAVGVEVGFVYGEYAGVYVGALVYVGATNIRH